MVNRLLSCRAKYGMTQVCTGTVMSPEAPLVLVTGIMPYIYRQAGYRLKK